MENNKNEKKERIKNTDVKSFYFESMLKWSPSILSSNCGIVGRKMGPDQEAEAPVWCMGTTIQSSVFKSYTR